MDRPCPRVVDERTNSLSPGLSIKDLIASLSLPEIAVGALILYVAEDCAPSVTHPRSKGGVRQRGGTAPGLPWGSLFRDLSYLSLSFSSKS